MINPERDGLGELQTFLVQLGAAMNEAGEPVYSVQERLARAAHAYGVDAARISAFRLDRRIASSVNALGSVRLPSAQTDRPWPGRTGGHPASCGAVRRTNATRAQETTTPPTRSREPPAS